VALPTGEKPAVATCQKKSLQIVFGVNRVWGKKSHTQEFAGEQQRHMPFQKKKA
jgi:hypothetical protein